MLWQTKNNVPRRNFIFTVSLTLISHFLQLFCSNWPFYLIHVSKMDGFLDIFGWMDGILDLWVIRNYINSVISTLSHLRMKFLLQSESHVAYYRGWGYRLGDFHYPSLRDCCCLGVLPEWRWWEASSGFHLCFDRSRTKYERYQAGYPQDCVLANQSCTIRRSDQLCWPWS